MKNIRNLAQNANTQEIVSENNSDKILSDSQGNDSSADEINRIQKHFFMAAIHREIIENQKAKQRWEFLRENRKDLYMMDKTGE